MSVSIPSITELLSPIVYQLGIGGIIGFVVGYAAKKFTKLVAIFAGLLAVLMVYLGSQGIININYGKLAVAVQQLLGTAGQAASWVTHLVANLPFGGSFLGGLALGFKLG